LSHAEILLHGFLAHGEDFLRKVNGIYAAVICDIEQLKLTIISDRFGMKPLYYAHRPGRFTAAAEIKALFVDRDVPRAADDSGMAQFFSFGHLFADNTLFQSVRALPPASILTYDLREDRVSIRGYWDLPGGPSAGAANTKVEAALLEEIDAAFGRAVQRSIDAGDHLGMALSGGLDARSILAAIDCRQTPLKTISMGVPGSLDHLSAARVAQLSGCPHHQYQLDSTVCDSASYRRNLAKVVHLTDGHYLDQVIVMPMLPTIQSLGIRILLRGHAGELMHMHKAYNYSLDEAAWSIRDEAGLEQWLMSRLSGWMLDNVPEPLLCRSSPSEVQDMAKETLRKCLAESAGVVPQLHRIWHLFIRQRLARETSASLAMINSVVETRVPLLDADLIATLLAAPPELKTSEVIQSHILRRRRPEFLRVLNANTGAPVGSPRWRQRAATLKMRVLAKLGVPGYQPYERLGLWLRRELRPLVSDILLVDRCLGRGVFVPETVRSVVQRHWNKQANHTFLIMAMMIHEMGLRQFADGDGQDSTVGRNLAGVS
jgi:asparagine synthase (glutamine-hydrolysing)